MGEGVGVGGLHQAQPSPTLSHATTISYHVIIICVYVWA